MRTLLACLGLLLTAARADADCGIRYWLGLDEGTELPERGVIFAHHEMADMHVDGGITGVTATLASGGSVKLTQVERNVIRIDYSGQYGDTLSIQDGWTERAQTMRVGDWLTPRLPPQVVQAWRNQSSWTCSSSDTLMIQLDEPVAAVRARWTYNGRAVDYIEAPQIDGTKVVVQFGKIDCGGTSIPPEQLEEGGELELFAIEYAGNEVPLLGLPRHVSFDSLPVRDDGVRGAMTLVARDRIRGTRTVVKQQKSEPGRGLGIVVLVLGGLGLVLAYRVLRRVETAGSDCSPASE